MDLIRTVFHIETNYEKQVLERSVLVVLIAKFGTRAPVCQIYRNLQYCILQT